MASDRARFSVRSKLLFILALPLVVCVALLGFSIGSRTIGVHGYDAALDWSEHAVAVNEARVAMLRFHHLVTTGANDRAPAARAELERASARSLVLASHFSEAELFEEEHVFADVTHLVAQGEDVLREPSPEAVAAFVRSYEDLDRNMLDRVADEWAGSQAAAREGKENSGRLMLFSTIGAVVVLILVGLIGFALARRLLRAIRYLEREADALASGDLERRIELDTGDELARLARAFDEMAANLRGSMIHKSDLEAIVMMRTAELQQSFERQRLLFDLSPVPICVFDALDGRFVAVNERASLLFGYSGEEFATRTIFDLVPDFASDAYDPGTSGIIDLGAQRVRCHDGTWLDIEMTAHNFVLDGRRCQLAIGVNVTEARKLEEQLRQTQKLEAIGQLAGGVAHDFNNILAVILTSAELVGEALPEDHAARPDLAEIMNAGNRAATLTRQLLAFSRKQTVQPRLLELNAVVGDISKMLARIIGENISLHANLEPDLDRINADAGQIEQILTNLVVNARDAMPEGGKLVIETANANVDAKLARELDVAPGDYVSLAVIDDGTGIDDITRQHIFEPFFTTKDVGKGTGLGLATVFGIVKQNNGGIQLQTEVGEGSTFRVFLPRAQIESSAVPRTIMFEDQTGPVLATRSRETVLVVEDEPKVRAVIRRRLLGWGYEVIEAEDGASAAALLEKTERSIDLLLTDLVMPGGVSGHALAASVAQTKPRMKVLFMTGHTDQAVRADHKPFTASELAVAIRSVLDDNPRTPSGHAGPRAA